MKLVMFTPPEGVRAPEGKGAGDTFESMATFQIKPDGRMCLVAIGDHKMPGYSSKDFTSPDNGDVAVAYKKALA